MSGVHHPVTVEETAKLLLAGGVQLYRALLRPEDDLDVVRIAGLAELVASLNAKLNDQLDAGQASRRVDLSLLLCGCVHVVRLCEILQLPEEHPDYAGIALRMHLVDTLWSLELSAKQPPAASDG